MLSSEQDGGGTDGIDSAPAGEELPVPQVDHREDWENRNYLHTCLQANNSHRHTIRKVCLQGP